jgi:hypothetical protein
MSTRIWLLSGAALALLAGVALAQHPMLDQAAQKVIQKYQSSSCEQLWENRGKQTPEQQRVISFLRTDPTLRQEFINKIAGPVANKMFDCGLIP